MHTFSPKKHETQLKISPGLSKRSSGSNRRDLGREHSILLSVDHMLCINQVYHGVSRCLIMGVVLRQAWSKSQWTVLMGYLTISTNARRYQTGHRSQFFFQEDSTQVHCVCNTIQLSEICDFRVSAFCQVVQKHKLFEVAY